MKLRSRRVLELGVGPRARKLVDLSLRHPKHHFIGSEVVPVNYGLELKERGQHTKPRNLEIRRNTDALSVLRNQDSASISHAFAHFLLQHVSSLQRHVIFAELHRVLEPNARFTTVEDIHYATVLRSELAKVGFVVTVRRIGPEELMHLKTYNADMNAQHVLRIRRLIASIPAKIPKSRSKEFRGAKTRDEVIQYDIQNTQAVVRRKLEQLEGPNRSREAQAAINQIVGEVPFGYRDKPFAVITVRKPNEGK